jgi:imidazole glycerol phosphate synthase subunit HisF
MAWTKIEKNEKLSKLGDIDFSTPPVDGNALVYDETNDVWVPSEGGGGSANYTDLIDTLEAGETSITITDNSITTDSMIDFYTDVFGVNPIGAVVGTGQITLTFEERSSDLGVKVRVWNNGVV